jgi:hypothetical protein
MGKKKDKPKRQKKEIVYRTKEERRNEVKKIISKLSSFDLNTTYEPIKNLYSKFKEYISEGQRMEINIPFPEINRRIKGLLAISVNEQVWINLKNEKFN